MFSIKKLLPILLVLAFVLGGCSDSKDNSKKDTASVNQSSASSVTSAESNTASTKNQSDEALSSQPVSSADIPSQNETASSQPDDDDYLEDNDYDYSYDDDDLEPQPGYDTSEDMIPEGGVYTVNVSGQKLMQGEMFPSKPRHYDVYMYEDYRYTYNDDLGGWSVKVIYTDKINYSSLLSAIAGAPVKSMYRTFANCKKMTSCPPIPDSVVDMEETFTTCTNLVNAPRLPDCVTNLSHTFSWCTSLKSVPNIPSAAVDLSFAFHRCESLTEVPSLPKNAKILEATFSYCKSLTVAPQIPNTVTNMKHTFYNCTSITVAPRIPDGVTDMSFTFYCCTSLTTVSHPIPESVGYMEGAFEYCWALTGKITINAILGGYSGLYDDCFLYTKQPIVLTGTSQYLLKLADTSVNKNITVE